MLDASIVKLFLLVMDEEAGREERIAMYIAVLLLQCFNIPWLVLALKTKQCWSPTIVVSDSWYRRYG